MNILIFKATYGFQYEVVNEFANELYSELINLDCTTKIIDINQPKETLFKQVLKELNIGIDLVIHFNGFLVDEFNDCNLLYNFMDNLNIPMAVILVDHPFYHKNRLDKFNKKNTFICLYDEGFLHCYENYIDKEMPLAHLFHAASYCKKTSIHKEKDIIIAGSIIEPSNLLNELNALEDNFFKASIINIYKNALKNYTIPLYEYFYDELNKLEITFEEIKENKALSDFLIYIYNMIDKNLRTKTRYETLITILDSGFIIDLYGNCSVEKLKKYNNLHIHGPINYIDLLEEISKSKILINDLCVFSNGSHERVLSSMLNKTLVFSNTNNFCNDNFQNLKSIIYYDINDTKDFINKINYYLINYKERELIVNNAYDIVSNNHTWKNRAEELLSIYNSYLKIK